MEGVDLSTDSGMHNVEKRASGGGPKRMTHTTWHDLRRRMDGGRMFGILVRLLDCFDTPRWTSASSALLKLFYSQHWQIVSPDEKHERLLYGWEMANARKTRTRTLNSMERVAGFATMAQLGILMVRMTSLLHHHFLSLRVSFGPLISTVWIC